eukprot:7884709-Karenia_brevis.AAC.1
MPHTAYHAQHNTHRIPHTPYTSCGILHTTDRMQSMQATWMSFRCFPEHVRVHVQVVTVSKLKVDRSSLGPRPGPGALAGPGAPCNLSLCPDLLPSHGCAHICLDA